MAKEFDVFDITESPTEIEIGLLMDNLVGRGREILRRLVYQRDELSAKKPCIGGLILVAEERQRQQEVEGWTDEHDDKHTNQSLAMAAALYAAPQDNLQQVTFCEDCNSPHINDPWPWWNTVSPPRGGPSIEVHAWDKRQQHDRIRRLQIAGALIVAEIERLQRQSQQVTKELTIEKCPVLDIQCGFYCYQYDSNMEVAICCCTHSDNPTDTEGNCNLTLCPLSDKLSFDTWFNANENDLDCEAAESGMDRELDFNKERWVEQRYDEYLKEK